VRWTAVTELEGGRRWTVGRVDLVAPGRGIEEMGYVEEMGRRESGHGIR
jgi:hypothetical protein